MTKGRSLDSSGVVLKNKKARGPGPHVPSSILANWDQEDVDILPAHFSVSAVSRLSSVAMDDNLTTGAGGIPSDDDEIEHQELDTVMQSSFHFQVRFILFFKNSSY